MEAVRAALLTLQGCRRGRKIVKEPCHRASSAVTMVHVQRRDNLLRTLCGCGYSSSCTMSFTSGALLDLPCSVMQLVAPGVGRHILAANGSISSTSLLSNGRWHHQPADHVGAMGSESAQQQLRQTCPATSRITSAAPPPPPPAAKEGDDNAVPGSKESCSCNSGYAGTQEAVVAAEQAAECTWREHEDFRLAWHMASLHQRWSEYARDEPALLLHEAGLRQRLQDASVVSMVTSRGGSYHQSAVASGTQQAANKDWEVG